MIIVVGPHNKFLKIVCLFFRCFSGSWLSGFRPLGSKAVWIGDFSSKKDIGQKLYLPGHTFWFCLKQYFLYLIFNCSIKERSPDEIINKFSFVIIPIKLFYILSLLNFDFFESLRLIFFYQLWGSKASGTSYFQSPIGKKESWELRGEDGESKK